MATYYTLQAGTNGRYPATDTRPGPAYAYAEFNIASAIGQGGAGGTAFVVNDIVRMVKIPKGARILDVTLKVPALDSSTGIVTAVGDQDGTPDEDRYISGATVGRSGAAGLQRMATTTGLGYQFAADGYLEFKVTTVASGTAVTAGVISLAAIYTMDA